MRLTPCLAHKPLLFLCLWAFLFASLGCEKNPYQNARLRHLGVQAFEADEIDRAYDLFEQAIEQDYADWKSLRYRGKCQLAQGRYTAARNSLKHSLHINDQHPQTDAVYDELALAIFKLKRFKELYAVLNTRCQETHRAYDYLRQGDYMVLINDIDQAKVAYKLAVKFSKKHERLPYQRLAKFYQGINDTQGEIKMLATAYGQDPTNATLENMLRAKGVVPGDSMLLQE